MWLRRRDRKSLWFAQQWSSNCFQHIGNVLNVCLLASLPECKLYTGNYMSLAAKVYLIFIDNLHISIICSCNHLDGSSGAFMQCNENNAPLLCRFYVYGISLPISCRWSYSLVPSRVRNTKKRDEIYLLTALFARYSRSLLVTNTNARCTHINYCLWFRAQILKNLCALSVRTCIHTPVQTKAPFCDRICMRQKHTFQIKYEKRFVFCQHGK